MRMKKVFFSGLAGFLAGLGGFGLGAYFGYYFTSSYVLAAVEGASLGLCLGAYISALDWLTLRRIGRAARALLVGALVGAVGGGTGLVFSEVFFGVIKGGLAGRLAAWALAGSLIGFSYGLASFSSSRMKNGAAGGAIGGLVGGFLLYLATDLLRLGGAWGKCVGFLLLGSSIGYAVGLVEEILKKSWLVQLTGRGEGQEYSLDRSHVKLGRGSSCDIRILDDKQVAIRHVDLRRESDGTFTVTRGEDAPAVLVNKQAVSKKPLEDGDVIQLGSTKLLYREKQTGKSLSGVPAAGFLILAAVSIILLAVDGRCEAQPSASSPSYEVNVSRVDTKTFPDLSILVTVTDGVGQPVRGLNRENFVLLEDGKETTSFTVQPVGEGSQSSCDVVFVFDTTGSMSGEIEGVKRVCMDFAAALTKGNIDVRLGLVTYGDSIRQTYDPVSSSEVFKSWISRLSASGGGDSPENSLKALETAVQLQLRDEAQKAFVLITDAPPHEAINSRGRRLTTRRVDEEFIGFLQQSGVTVYSIAVDIHQYRSISSQTGGMFFHIQKDESEFMELVNTLGSILANQYNFRFKSRRPRMDGTWRGVSVRVVDRERVIGRGKTDYLTTGLTGGKLETGFRLPFLALFVLSFIFYLILPGIIENVTPGWAAGTMRGAGLLALSGSMEGKRFLLKGGRMTIGKGIEADLSLAEIDLVCIEKRSLGGYILRINGGGGIVQVNATAVSGECELHDGDVIKIGSKKFLFKAAVDTQRGVTPGGGDKLVPLDNLSGLGSFALVGECLQIGRSQDADICVEHSSVSRNHAELIKKEQGFVVRDVGSKNGTFVNDRRVTENLLKDGFTVRFGEVSFRIELARTPVPSSTEQAQSPPAAVAEKPSTPETCASCGTAFRPGGKFCPGCGKQA